VLVALFALLFGIFAPVVVRLMLATPKAFIATLAGLALLRVLERAFAGSFKGRLYARRHGLLPGDGGECADLLDRGTVLGGADRPRGILVAGTQRFRGVAGRSPAGLTEIEGHGAAVARSKADRRPERAGH